MVSKPKIINGGFGIGKVVQVRSNTLSWTALSTFYAYANRTGPWDKLIVMTTCNSVSRCGKKQLYDKTYAYQTFNSIKRSEWATHNRSCPICRVAF